MVTVIANPKFPLGQVVATPALLSKVNAPDCTSALTRHAQGDWGTVCQEDQTLNDWSLANGERLLSAYESSAGIRFWIITEWDRSATTILLPEDY